MNYKLLTIGEVCQILRWGETKLYERRAAGLFPSPFNVSGSKKGNSYFEHEIEFYIKHAIRIACDDQFKLLAREIELSRLELVV